MQCYIKINKKFFFIWLLKAKITGNYKEKIIKKKNKKHCNYIRNGGKNDNDKVGNREK